MPTVVVAYAAVVGFNYAMQVPYAIDLYGLRFSRPGALLLGATLAWFVAALWLYATGRRGGRPILVAFVFVQVVFYTHDVLMTLAGHGLGYQLTHARDSIVWLAFVAGAANLVAATAVVVWLAARRNEPGTRGVSRRRG